MVLLQNIAVQNLQSGISEDSSVISMFTLKRALTGVVKERTLCTHADIIPPLLFLRAGRSFVQTYAPVIVCNLMAVRRVKEQMLGKAGSVQRRYHKIPPSSPNWQALFPSIKNISNHSHLCNGDTIARVLETLCELFGTWSVVWNPRDAEFGS